MSANRPKVRIALMDERRFARCFIFLYILDRKENNRDGIYIRNSCIESAVRA